MEVPEIGRYQEARNPNYGCNVMFLKFGRDLTIFYSYKTPVAFLTVSKRGDAAIVYRKNRWGQATASHQNEIGRHIRTTYPGARNEWAVDEEKWLTKLQKELDITEKRDKNLVGRSDGWLLPWRQAQILMKDVRTMREMVHDCAKKVDAITPGVQKPYAWVSQASPLTHVISGLDALERKLSKCIGPKTTHRRRKKKAPKVQSRWNRLVI